VKESYTGASPRVTSDLLLFDYCSTILRRFFHEIFHEVAPSRAARGETHLCARAAKAKC
jgi:hypothetical protein